MWYYKFAMDTNFEKKKIQEGFLGVIGCDEVGRGCLAGPVVAAAVIFNCESLNRINKIDEDLIEQIKDSKLLTPKKREELAKFIKESSIWSIAEVDEKIIDEINIHRASLLAMKKAVERLLLPSPAQGDSGQMLIVIDGKFKIPEFNMKQEAIVGGDNKVLSIAAASIIAKVYRDELMQKLHEQFPEYNFSKHKGYATLHHREMIKKHGLTPRHRLSFCKSFVS